jgi:ADP-ribose pyrophosphatase
MPKAAKPVSWKRLGSTVLLRHPRMTIAEDDVELPDGQVTKYIYQQGGRNSVSVVALRGDAILIQQEYSYPPNLTMYQLPGGSMEHAESSEEAALRELKEESGYIGTPSYLGYYYPRNRTSDSKMHVVVMDNVETCKKEGGDAEEFITSEWISLSRLRTMIASGKIVNFSILAALAMYDAKNTT